MRVTTAVWVGALLRRVSAGGAFAAVEKKGSAEAGSIYLVVNDLEQGFSLYGPAMQAFYEDRPQDRLFERLAENGEESLIRKRLDRERSFDPDLWIIEIEDRQARNFLEIDPV